MLLKLFLLCLTCVPAFAVDIDVSFDALQKIIGNQMFAEDGRRYVKGSKAAACNYAYLANPKIAGVGDKLRVSAKFTGRSSVGVQRSGTCIGIGMGDSFDLNILATPYANQGEVRFKDVKVDSNGRRGMYVDRVVAQLQNSFASQFKLPIDKEAKRLLDFPEAPAGELSRKVDNFRLQGIEVIKDAVVLKVDFHVMVR